MVLYFCDSMGEACEHKLKVERVLNKSSKGEARILCCKLCGSRFLEMDGFIHEVNGGITEKQIGDMLYTGINLKVKP
jgi:hypothetical protein